MKNLTFKIILFIVFNASVLTLAQNDQPSFYETHWLLKSINNKKTDIKSEISPFIEFVNDSVAEGYTGCNKINARYSITRGKLKFTTVACSKMKCNEHKFENELISVLHKCNNYSLKKRQLILKTDQKELAVFEAETIK